MKLSRAVGYALQALVDLADQPHGSLRPSHVVAQAHGVPERFLLKVLNPLVRARILHGVKGPNGGYALARRVRDITLLEVVEAVDGPVRGEVPRVVQQDNNVRLDDRLEAIYGQMAEHIRRQLQKVRIADLVRARA
jgi:Rrf2 family protein